MCITEYNEAETMALFKEEGREEGQEEHLLRQICRKLRKGKSAPQIADELEEDPEMIRRICSNLKEFSPAYDERAVIDAVRRLSHSASGFGRGGEPQSFRRS